MLTYFCGGKKNYTPPQCSSGVVRFYVVFRNLLNVWGIEFNWLLLSASAIQSAYHTASGKLHYTYTCETMRVKR